MRQRAMVSEARLELALNALSTRSLCRLGYSDKISEALSNASPIKAVGGPPEIRTPTSGIKNPALCR
jgi:hypothetical protein